MNVDGEDWVHPRKRICDTTIEDGDICEIWVQDKTVETTSSMQLWQDQAFGKERNMMTINITFMSEEKKIKEATDGICTCTYTYKMAPEVMQEFDPKDWKEECTFDLYLMEQDEGIHNNWFEYTGLKLPYGEISFKFKVKVKDKEIEVSQNDPYMKIEFEPKPILASQQKVMDEEEERKNEEKQAEAKRERQRLEKKKADEAFEREQQIMQQAQNTMKLDQYWRVMNLQFFKTEEDASVSLAILSLYLDNLMDYFQFYSALQKQQMYKNPVNYLITLQSMIHYMKTFRFCESKQDIQVLAQN